MMKRMWPSLCALLIGFASGACDGSGPEGASSSSGNSGGAPTTTTGPGAGTGGDAGGEEGCDRTLPPSLDITSEDCTQVGTVTGQVLDQDGNPPSTTTITVCGDACMYGDTEPDGTFSMTVDHCYKGSSFYEVPIMIYHGYPEYADVTVKFVPDGASDVPTADLGLITTVALDASNVQSYPEQAATTFTDDAGFELTVDECQLVLPAFQDDMFIGAVDPAAAPLPDAPPDLAGLYFVAPDNAHFNTPAMVRFPNTAALAAGTAVELMAIGNMGTTTVIEAGTWGPVGTGRVSDDGMYVVSDPAADSGLITLGWIGYRETQ